MSPAARLARAAGLALAALAAVAALAGPPDARDAIVLAVKVNGVPRGDALVVPAEGSRELWVRERDVKAFRLSLPPFASGDRSGDFVRLRSAASLGLALDLDGLELAIDAAPELLARQQFSLSSRPALVPEPATGVGGFLDYALSSQSASGTRQAFAADMLANVSWNEWIARTTGRARFTAGEGRYQRGDTMVLRDDVGRMLRWSAGDVAPAGAFGGRVPAMAGLAVERLFAVAPGFIAQPTATFAGSVRAPAVAEVLVDGARVRTIPLAPGTWEFRDLSYYSGLRNVEIVIRDRAGNVETLRLPVYFSGENLREGLHEFRYAAGASRLSPEGVGTYGGAAFSARHRYGLSDDLTLSASAESLTGYASAGAGALLRLPRLGIVSAHAAWSRSASGQSGTSALATWSYGGARITASASGFHQSREFGEVSSPGISLAPGRPRDRVSASLGTGLGPQRTLTLDGTRGRTWEGIGQSQVGARLTQGFANGASLGLAVAHRTEGASKGADLSLTLSVPLGRGVTLNTATDRRGDAPARLSASVSVPVPSGEGIGWRADIERDASLRGFGAQAVANTRSGTLAVAARRIERAGAGASDALDARWSGSLVTIGGGAFLSRTIEGAYALAEVPGIADVRIYQNGQLVGRTDAAGRLLVPSLGAYATNQISIDDRDVPVDRELPAVRREIVPREFIGARVRFEARRVSAVGGVLALAGGSAPARMASAEIVVRAAGVERRSVTGPEGDFYLDDLEPGSYAIEATGLRASCRAAFSLAEGRGPFIDLGEVRCDAIAR